VLSQSLSGTAPSDSWLIAYDLVDLGHQAGLGVMRMNGRMGIDEGCARGAVSALFVRIGGWRRHKTPDSVRAVERV
jgi:hypothetical protein